MTISNSLSHNKICCENAMDVALLINDGSLGLIKKKKKSYYNRQLLFNFISTLANVCTNIICNIVGFK